MNKTSEAKLGMYKAVINYCAANIAIVNLLPAFGAGYTALQAKVAAINTASQQQVQVITGLSANKTALREDLCAKAADLCSLLFAWASVTANLVVKDQVSFSPTEMNRLKDEMLIPTCKNIMTIASGNMAALANYGVLPATVSALDAAITAYTPMIVAPRNAVTQRSTYTANLTQLFKDADVILKTQMDRLAVQFKKTQPDFYNTYFNNRIIVDAGVTSTKIKGMVTSATDQAGIAGAVVSIAGQDEKATTDVTGKFIMLVKPGVYNLQFSKPGYQDKMVNNIVVKRGKEIMADAEMMS